MNHSCAALVLSCIDYRFQSAIRNWLVQNGLENRYDYLCRPGAGKDTDAGLVRAVGLSVKLHGIKKVIIIHHQNCGAYGGELESGSEAERTRHQADMAISVELFKRSYPELAYETYFAKLDGEIVGI